MSERFFPGKLSSAQLTQNVLDALYRSILCDACLTKYEQLGCPEVIRPSEEFFCERCLERIEQKAIAARKFVAEMLKD